MQLGARQYTWPGGAAPGPTPAYWGLCFTAEQANSTVAMAKIANSRTPTVTLLYSTNPADPMSWAEFIVGSTTVTLANVGDKVWIKAGTGGNTNFSYGANYYNYFSLTGLLAASGSIMSLLNGEVELDSCNNYSFTRLFVNCTSLTAAPTLPATTLANTCYGYMFYGCTSLTAAPTLPATTLARACYRNMFDGCSSLSTIRTAQTDAWSDSPSSSPTTAWVEGVAATGTFYCPTAIGTNETITRGISACPEGWTVVNI